MAVFLPDIIGEYMDAPLRYETGGVQYAGYFEPATLAPEQVANLYLFVQNTLNVPLTASLKVEVPRTKGLFSSKPVLQVKEPGVQIQLAAAEAGLLVLPVTTTTEAEAGDYELALEVKTLLKNKGQQIRPLKAQSDLQTKLMDSLVGLDLVSTMGATFTCKSVKKGTFAISIAGEPQPMERAAKLEHQYETIWTQDQMELFNQAIQEINSRETKIEAELTTEALYTNLYAESVTRFADVKLPLRVGEAITLAKILTYTCQFFLSDPQRRNGLLVPIWQQALAGGLDTTYALELIRTAGYLHVLKLAIMLSFGLIAQVVGRQFWSLKERQAVTLHVADVLETGEALDLEFLYLPLLMAGTHISRKFVLEGENAAHSLALMKKAREARFDLFTDPDTAQADKVYDQILKKALASQGAK